MNCRSPGGRIGATATALLLAPDYRFRLSAAGRLGFVPAFRSWAPGLAMAGSGARRAELACFWRRCRITSGSQRAAVYVLFRPIPVERNSVLWECNVTPVHCTCQEGNTICCVPSNDGLGAGVRSFFPQIGWLTALASGHWLGCRKEMGSPGLKPPAFLCRLRGAKAPLFHGPKSLLQSFRVSAAKATLIKGHLRHALIRFLLSTKVPLFHGG